MVSRSYCINIAKKYGIPTAIILHNIMYWVDHNKSNMKNFHDGYYWTYNTSQAFIKDLPDLTLRQIRYAINKLIEDGLILTGNYNENCSRMLWYTYTEKAVEMSSDTEYQRTTSGKTVSSPTPNEPEDNKERQELSEDVTKLSNRSDKIVNTYLQNCQYEMTKLSNDTDNKPTDINNKKETHKEKDNPVVCVFEFWNSQKLLQCHELTPKLRSFIAKALTKYTLSEIKLYISRYAEALNSSYFMSYQWSLSDFITLHNAMPEFTDTGGKWLNYSSWKANTSPPGQFTHNNYSKEQISSIITDLDTVEL